MGIDYYRGHQIQQKDGQWFYCDTGEPTAGNRRDCGHCGLTDTPEGHDGCLGTLPGVMNACCGHGDEDEAYLQFDHENYDKEPNKFWVGGKEAVEMINSMKEKHNGK